MGQNEHICRRRARRPGGEASGGLGVRAVCAERHMPGRREGWPARGKVVAGLVNSACGRADTTGEALWRRSRVDGRGAFRNVCLR